MVVGMKRLDIGLLVEAKMIERNERIIGSCEKRADSGFEVV